MNIVLDECIPRQLRHLLPGHNVRTVRELGASGLVNGELLARIAQTSGCDVFITGDRNMPFQQSLTSRPFAIVILRARSNRIADLSPLMPEVVAALPELRAGEVRTVGTWRDRNTQTQP